MTSPGLILYASRAVLLLGLSVPVAAHESRPTYIEVAEIAPLHFRLQWKIPPTIPPSSAPVVMLPRFCEPQNQLAEFAGPDSLVRRMTYHCLRPLSGYALTIAYPGSNPAVSSLLDYRTLNRQRHIVLLGPQETKWIAPNAETTEAVAAQYALLGIEHIWTGVDHLLFLTCLLWIAGTWRRILITITGFTLAHSITLALSALDVMRLPIPPVEAAIALSIVFLATELIKGPRRSLTWRYPIAVASSFGLLHGFGFAAALAQIGLPQTELVTGLLFFNVGVEVGQIVFACAVILLMRALAHVSAGSRHRLQLPVPVAVMAGYAIGALAACWLLQRGSTFWSA